MSALDPAREPGMDARVVATDQFGNEEWVRSSFDPYLWFPVGYTAPGLPWTELAANRPNATVIEFA